MAVAPVIAVLPVSFPARSVVKFVTWLWAIVPVIVEAVPVVFWFKVGMSEGVNAELPVTKPFESYVIFDAVAPVMAVLPVIFAARSVVKFVTWPWVIAPVIVEAVPVVFWFKVGTSAGVNTAPPVTRPLES